MKTKKAYFVTDLEYGVAVVAFTGQEAKKLAWKDDLFSDTAWIDLKAELKKHVDVSKLDVGVINDYLLALKLGIFGFVESETCPKCKRDDVTVFFDEGYYCSHCEVKP